jgi:hypothetical protein
VGITLRQVIGLDDGSKRFVVRVRGYAATCTRTAPSLRKWPTKHGGKVVGAFQKSNFSE